MKNIRSGLIWLLVALVGAFAFAMLALSRGEHVNAVWLVVAAVACYSIAYRFYSRFIADKVFELDDRRLTPAERHNDGRTTCPPTNGYCSATTSPPSPAPGRWWGRFWPRRWASCRGPSGSRSASCWPARCRISGAVHFHAPRRAFAGEMAKQSWARSPG